MRKFFAFIKLPLSTQLLVIKAFILLQFCQFSVNILRFNYIIKLYNLQPYTEKQKISPKNFETQANLIAWAISRTQSMPQFIRPRCLAQALAARILLHQEDEPCILSMGATLEDNALIAHAWLKCGDIVVIGQSEKHKFTEIVSYC